jgi:WD40 repeat protein
VYDVDFSPDGATLAAGGVHETVILWDVESGEENAALKGHSGDVHAVDFTPTERC